MFFQILVWLSKIPNILVNLGVLRDANKRRSIGKGLVALHQSLLHLSASAFSIEKSIRILSESTDDFTFKFFVPILKEALEAQRVELSNLDYILHQLQPFLQIYGDELLQHILQMSSSKNTILKVLSWVLRERDEETLVLPKSFDLTTINCVVTELPSLDRMRTFQGEDAKRFASFYTVKFCTTKKGIKAINKHAQDLLAEIVKMQAGEKLQRIAHELSGVIQFNFKVEELFY